MDRLDAMRAFVTVAELRGFAPAARKLGISPSGVTRLVAGLEDHLGIRLLQRTTRAVALSDAGGRYLDRARRILADVTEADEAARAERRDPAGRLVVTAPLVFGRMHVAPVLGAFLARHRAVVGELVLADRMVQLVDEGVDVAVRIGHLADAGLVARKVGETRRVWVASPDYLGRRGRPTSERTLAAHDVVHCTAIQTAPEFVLHTARGVRRVAFTPRFVTNSVDAAIGQAELGFGITSVLGYQVADAVRAGRLELVLEASEPPPLPIHLVYAHRRNLSAVVRAFTETVVSSCAWDFVDLGAPARRAARRRR